MAITKIVGIETEYGIAERDRPADAQNPIASSSLLINAYVSNLAKPVAWDFEDEHPGNDARLATDPGAQPPEIEKHLVNAVLTNGARFYVDHAHPEYSSPECLTVLEAVIWDRAGEMIVRQAIESAQRQYGRELIAHKNNSDGKGNSYGTHENYLASRATPFSRIVNQMTPHFVTRQLYCGAGKLGSEAPGRNPFNWAAPFQLSQRADFFEEEVGLETTIKRPIINTRDEPHSDAAKYRRLHVIVGDANMSETATLLKMGTTAIILAMIEDDALASAQLELRDPVRAITRVSYDLALDAPLDRKNGKTITALELQWELLDRAKKYAESDGLECVGAEVGQMVLTAWETALHGLSALASTGGVTEGIICDADEIPIAQTIDWIAKLKLLSDYRSRSNLKWNDAKLGAIALQYHDMRAGKNLSDRVGLKRITTDIDVKSAITDPPVTTRAYFRGTCLSKYPDQISAANWDSIVFDLGTDPLRRVPMMEPMRGTKEVVGDLLDKCTTAAELVHILGA